MQEKIILIKKKDFKNLVLEIWKWGYMNNIEEFVVKVYLNDKKIVRIDISADFFDLLEQNHLISLLRQ